VTRQRRFALAVAFTVLVVAYTIVPWVAALIEGVMNYNPPYYEPRDFTRMERQRNIADPGTWTSDALINAGLFVLLAVVWFMATSGGRHGGRGR